MDPLQISGVMESLSKELGFDFMTISSADPLEEDRQIYQNWVEKGYAADLHYMVREIPRRWVAQDLLPEAQTVLTFGVNFFPNGRIKKESMGMGRWRDTHGAWIIIE